MSEWENELKSRSRLIAVAGIVGVGKTTLAEGLGEELGARVIYEEYDQNPFLAEEFGGRKEAGLPSELFFLLSRARQLHRQAIGDQEIVVSDYVFDKNRIYARMNLDEEQLGIYEAVEKSIERHLRRPDVVIYLFDTVERCRERIERRGREFEKSITVGWLSRLHQAYEKLMANWEEGVVARIDCTEYDMRQAGAVREIAQQVHSLAGC